MADGSDFSETFSDEVEIIVRTKECLNAKLVSLAEDEGEKVAIVEFDTGEKRIRKLKCVFKEALELDVDSDEVAVEVRTKSDRKAKLLMQAEDEGELVALIQYEDTGETKLTRQISNRHSRSRGPLAGKMSHPHLTKHNSSRLTSDDLLTLYRAGSNSSAITQVRDSSRSPISRSRKDSYSSVTSFGGRTFRKRKGVGEIPKDKSYLPKNPKLTKKGSRHYRTVTADSMLEIVDAAGVTEWKCDLCGFSNLNSSPKCLMCMKPNEARSRKLASAQRILVSGRRGFNEEMNGCYEQVEDFYQGKTCYVHVESDWCIYWSRAVERWVFDCRGMLNDQKACAISDEDVPSPHLVSGDWVVYNGSSGWAQDPHVKIRPWIELH